jgi:hypothetical protein
MSALLFAGVALQASVASANTTETVKQASVDFHAADCTNQLIGNVKFSAHFIITQVSSNLADGQPAPATITVTWSDASTEFVPIDDPGFNGNAASYTTTQHAGLTVLTATASMYDGWAIAAPKKPAGEFVLSHYNCGDLANISIGPSAVNDIGKGETSHTFTVTVNGTSLLNPVTVTTTVNAAPATCAGLTGVGTTTVTCTVTVTSLVPAGPFVAHAAATGTVGITPFNIATNGAAPNSGDATKVFACKTHTLNLSITGAGKSTVSHTGLTTGGWTVTFDYTYQTFDGANWSASTSGSATGSVLVDGGIGALTIGASPVIPTPNAAYHARVQWTFTIRDNTSTVLFGPSGTKPTPSTYVDLDNVGNCSGSDSALSPVSDVTVFKYEDPDGDGVLTVIEGIVFENPISGWTITATSPGNDPISGVTNNDGSAQLVGLDDLVTWTICESPARTTPSETQWIQTVPSFGGCYTRQDLAHRTAQPEYDFGNTHGTSTTVTTLHKPNGATVANGSQLDLGSSIYDTAAVTSFPTPTGAPAATGTVTFTLYSGTCGSGSPLLSSNNVALGSSSDTFGPLAAGDYYIVAVYSGDSRYAGSTGACEPFNIKKANLSLVTTMYSGQILLANGGQLPAGTLPRSVRDTATVSGLVDGFPANNVTFQYFTNGTCANTGAAAGSAPIGQGGLADGSATESVTGAGSYSFLASVLGDSNYNGGSAACESFTVTTVTINKLANGGNATFNFTLGDQTPSIQTQGTPGTGTTTVVVLAGAFTLGEGAQDGWQLVGIVCAGGNASFTAAAGTNTACNVENTHNGATRTQGFWATHTDFANAKWANVPTSGAYSISCVSQTITATAGNGQNILMGSFWSNIAQTSTGAKRTALGKARTQLLQQLTAALLNKYGLGADDQGKIAAAVTAYCGTNGNAITNATGVLSTWNQSGDTVPLTGPWQGAATTSKSKSQANLIYWDTHNQ